MKSATFSRSAGTPPVAVPLTCNSGAYEPCSSAAQLLAWPPWEYPMMPTGVLADSPASGRRVAARAASSTAWPAEGPTV